MKTFKDRVIERLKAQGCKVLSNGSKSVKLSDPRHAGHYYYVSARGVRWGRNKQGSISLTTQFREV